MIRLEPERIRILCWQTILKEYHTLFLLKIGKNVANFVFCCSRDWRFRCKLHLLRTVWIWHQVYKILFMLHSHLYEICSILDFERQQLLAFSNLLTEKWHYLLFRVIVCILTFGPQRHKTCSKFRCDTFHKANNKGADKTAGMHRLVCTFVARKTPKTGFLSLMAHVWR